MTEQDIASKLKVILNDLGECWICKKPPIQGKSFCSAKCYEAYVELRARIRERGGPVG